MMLITCMIYFKYRIINKIMVMNISVELGYNFGVYYKILIFIRVAFWLVHMVYKFYWDILSLDS